MNNNTVAREVFEGFEGLEIASARGRVSSRLDNFRVLADGSLETREGLRHVASLPSQVRGVYSFTDREETVILAVAGNALYRLSSTGEDVCFSPCLDTDSGEVGFFEYGGRLYLLDGVRIYRYEGGCEATRVRGYTPLYGKNWAPQFVYSNRVNEPINSFSPDIRVQYSVSGGVDFVYVGMELTGVRWVMADGHYLDASEYSVAPAGDHVRFGTTRYESNIEICVTLADRYYLDGEFASATSAAVYEDFENTRVFLYGGNKSSALYVSCPVDGELLKKDRELFSDSCGLYFPKTQQLAFGSGEPITAVGRIYDRMMIFFPSSLWVTERLGETKGYGMELMPICHHMGCSSKNAMLLTGTASPISVTHGGIYRWRIDSDLLDECVAVQLLGPAREILGESFLSHAEVCYQRHRAELWFRDKSRADGRMLIYHLDRETWYCYSDIKADRLFGFGGGIGVTYGNEVLVFDDTLTADHLADGAREIRAVYQSGWLEFDGVGAEKRLAGTLLTAELGDGCLRVRLSDHEALAEVEIKAREALAPHVYEPRTPSCRFRTARLTLVADGPSRQRIYRAELLAQKGKQ